MNKCRELFKAFRQLPTLFCLIYNTDRHYLFYMFFETISFAVMEYPAILLSKYALDAMESGTPFFHYAVKCCLFILLGFIIRFIKSVFNEIRPGRTILVRGKLYNAFHKKSMELDYELLAEKEIQELQSLAGNFIQYQLSGVVWNFVSLFSKIIAFVISCVMLSSVNVVLILAAVISIMLDSVVLAATISGRFVLEKEISSCSRHTKYYHDLSAKEEYAKDLRIFDMNEDISQRAYLHTQEFLTLKSKQCRLDFVNSLCHLISSQGLNLIIYAILGWLVLKNQLSIGTIVLSISNLALFRTNLENISKILTGYSETAKYLEHYNRFMSLKSKFQKTGTTPVTLQPEEPFQIEFRDVSFRYPGQTEYTLEHFNLLINSQEKISVVGENGAGKSTFIKLLMRLYDPTSGTILLNDKDIRAYDYDSYLSIFTPVFQDYKLFAFTAYENISAFSDSNPAQVIEAAKKAGIDQYLEQLPNGYHTCLTKQFDEEGVLFSGGEQQKIALARAYYKRQALITILDEPTSALDPKAEYAIYQQFYELVGSNTAFFISHRLSSTRFCDKILLIKNKQAAEFGSHKELMKKRGEYYLLYSLQASYYDPTQPIGGTPHV